ncbi:MAG: ATP-binding protein [Deltaproteobacteria bacterium]|nr:ATP-binding protein [Deltaproteobacteria bacterium]
MEDLSLHILDIVENATTAGATRVEIRIIEDTKSDLLQITIKDDGHGMDSQTLKGVTDPFVTSRTTRRVGLGIPLFEQAAREAGGRLSVASEAGLGTELTATFQAGHIDRKPMGDMGATLVSLIAGNPDVDFVYEYKRDGKRTSLDTRSIKDEIEGFSTISDPKILQLIQEMVNNPES